jgi:hypothetical protein
MLSLLHMIALIGGMDQPVDFAVLDREIERCERESVLPVFSSEGQRRSAFVSTAYQEQASISAERSVVAAKRRALREAALAPASGKAVLPTPPESDQLLALGQLALEDRQRALDDRRRLESMRQEAVDLKRQYFLTHCAPTKKKAD